jgi:hypothetical protein
LRFLLSLQNKLLIGELKKPDNGSHDFVMGELTDQSGNYDVMYFGLDKNAPANPTFDHSVPKGTNLLKVYLMEKGTRNFSVIETTVLNDIIDYNSVYSNIENLNVVDHKVQAWYASVLEEAPIPTVARPAPLIIVSGQSDRTYTVSYPLGIGGTIYEEIVVRHYIEGPTSISNDGTFTTKMYILSERTYSYDYPSANSSNTNFTIGYHSPTTIGVATDKGDALRSNIWGGGYKQAGGVSLSFKIGVTFKKLLDLVGMDLNWTTTSTVTNNYRNYDNYPVTDQYSRLGGVSFNAGLFIENKWVSTTNESFDAQFTVGHFGNSGVQKTFLVKVSYDLVNGMDFYDPGAGLKESNLSISYYS